jgi:hypothetical protein
MLIAEKRKKLFNGWNRAVRQRDPGAPEFKTEPLMKSLRPYPHYTELLRKMRLPLH